MATLTKMDMIKALIESGSIEEMKKEKEDTVKLASRLFRTLPNDRVKELYAAKIAVQPEEVVEEVAKKISDMAKSKTEKPAKAEKKVQKTVAKKKEVAPEYLPAEDEKGNVYKKAWVLEELNTRGFGELKEGIRVLKGKSLNLVYHLDSNSMSAVSPNKIDKSTKSPKIVGRTLCICPFITKAFIDKYLKK